MESWYRNYQHWQQLLNPPDRWRNDPGFTQVLTRRFFDFLSIGWSIVFVPNTNPLWRYGIQVDEMIPGYQWLDDDDGDVYG